MTTPADDFDFPPVKESQRWPARDRSAPRPRPRSRSQPNVTTRSQSVRKFSEEMADAAEAGRQAAVDTQGTVRAATQTQSASLFPSPQSSPLRQKEAMLARNTFNKGYADDEFSDEDDPPRVDDTEGQEAQSTEVDFSDFLDWVEQDNGQIVLRDTKTKMEHVTFHNALELKELVGQYPKLWALVLRRAAKELNQRWNKL